MQKTLLIVLIGALCVEGGVADLPQSIDIPHAFRRFLKYLVVHTIYSYWSSMQSPTFGELLRRLLPLETMRGFLFIAGCERPDRNDPYANHLELLKFILGSPRARNILWNQSIVLLEVDPLNWSHIVLLGPPVTITDDVDPVVFQKACCRRKEIIISGNPIRSTIHNLI